MTRVYVTFVSASAAAAGLAVLLVAMARSPSLEGRLVAILNEQFARWAVTRRLLAGVIGATSIAFVAVATLHAQDEEPLNEPHDSAPADSARSTGLVEEVGEPAPPEQDLDAGSTEASFRETHGLIGLEQRAVLDLIARGDLDPSEFEELLPHQSHDHDDPLQSIGAIAGMDNAEVAAIDRLLRSDEFESLEAVFAEMLPHDAEDAASPLQEGLRKLKRLWARQTAALEEIAALRADEHLTADERRALDALEKAVKVASAPRALTIRRSFQPDPTSDARASWSAIVKRGDSYFALARSPLGDEFPVRMGGEEEPRFRIRVVDGNDDMLVVVLVTPDHLRDDQLPRVECRLVRDQSIYVDVGGERYSLLYPSTYIRRSGETVTDQATVIVSYHPDADSPKAEQNGLRFPVDVERAMLGDGLLPLRKPLR